MVSNFSQKTNPLRILYSNTDSWSRDGLQRLLRSHFLHGVVVFLLIIRHEHLEGAAGSLLLLVEVIDDHSDKQVQREERSEDDEEHKVQVHVDVGLPDRLLAHLQGN